MVLRVIQEMVCRASSKSDSGNRLFVPVHGIIQKMIRIQVEESVISDIGLASFNTEIAFRASTWHNEEIIRTELEE